MSRSFVTAMTRLAREHVREQERRVREMQRAVREEERARKATERVRIYDAKEKKRLHQEDRVSEVNELNDALETRVEELQQLLVKGLGAVTEIDFASLAVTPKLPALNLKNLQAAESAPNWKVYAPSAPHFLIAWLPPVKKSYEDQVTQARQKFEAESHANSEREAIRLRTIKERQEEHNQKLEMLRAEAEFHNSKLNGWKEAFFGGEKEAIEDYVTLVLSKCERPEGFPQKFKVAYQPTSKQLVLEYDLPEMDAVVPTCKGYSYVKATDKVNESAMTDKQRRALYAGALAQTTLQTLHEIFTSERSGFIESIVLNGFVDTINPGTGQRIRPCVVTVRTTRDTFATLNLKNVDPIAALQTLNASFSRSPAELAPVRPLLEFDMVDPRFIKESDVLSTLDQRPNLMELNPSEFESLITNLFQKMGLETKLTQASRDGGVDCVAYDPRPIFGGKIVIQAKRYKHTVGVSAVRDLYGTMQNEGASKGILVTTSGYGKAAFDFISGKPMELLDGSNLLYLLKTHAGIEAKIVAPADWRDPVADDFDSKMQ